MKLFTIFFLFFISFNCYSQFDKYNVEFIGLSDEYYERFLEHKQRITKGINSLDLPRSFFPVNILISYENGEGLITISANYIHDDIFTPDSKYSRANINRRVFGEGITFILPKVLITILRDYKFDVATNGGYKVDKKFLDFKSSVKLNSGQDFVQIYAYDQYDNQRIKTYFYTNVFLKYGNELYELEPKNISNFNDIDFFYTGKTIGLDGKPTPYYYFSKFFKIDEWETTAKREENIILLDEQQNTEKVKTIQEEFEDKVQNGIGYVYCTELSNKDDIKLSIDTKAIPIIYDFIKQIKDKYPHDYKFKVEAYESNIKWAASNGNKPEDYEMFDFFIYFNKDKSLDKIEFNSALTKDIELPLQVYSNLKNYIDINTIPLVSSSAIDYPVNFSSMLFFSFKDSTSNIIIDFQVNKDGEITFLSSVSDSLLKNYLNDNTKITGLERGIYKAHIVVLNTHYRLSHFLNYNKAERINNNEYSFDIKSINKL